MSAVYSTCFMLNPLQLGASTWSLPHLLPNATAHGPHENKKTKKLTRRCDMPLSSAEDGESSPTTVRHEKMQDTGTGEGVLV